MTAADTNDFDVDTSEYDAALEVLDERSAITIAGLEARLAPKSIAEMRMEGGIFGAQTTQTTEITSEMLGHTDA